MISKGESGPERVFKTAWCSKMARKAGIKDEELWSAIRQVKLGQAVDLGGGVLKKRLDKNRSRAIILAKAGRFWIYEYLFAKRNRDNIADSELLHFRDLAKTYKSLSIAQVDDLLANKDWLEICDGTQKEI